MSTEIVVGLIGLGGALVGALAAFLGIVYQQREQAKNAKQQRLNAMSERAVDALIADLGELRAAAWALPADDAETREDRTEWYRVAGPILDRIQTASLRIPNAELREILEAACVMGFGNEKTLQERVGLRVGRTFVVTMCSEAQKVLGYHLRGEPLPQTLFLHHARDLMREAVRSHTS